VNQEETIVISIGVRSTRLGDLDSMYIDSYYYVA